MTVAKKFLRYAGGKCVPNRKTLLICHYCNGSFVRSASMGARKYCDTCRPLVKSKQVMKCYYRKKKGVSANLGSSLVQPVEEVLT